MDIRVGQKVYVKNGQGLNHHGEVVCLLVRQPGSTEPYIVVKMMGTQGEFVAAVFEKDIVPPPPVVLSDKELWVWDDRSIGWHASGIQPVTEDARIAAWRFRQYSDGTWKIEQVK